MQSKTSCFNRTVFRKNITRFAPAWGLYTLALVVGLAMMLVNAGTERQYWPVAHMAELPQIMAFVNLGYALLTAQLLFGDLYASRSCYALHALPLKRESWFVTNVVSGLFFSLVPTLVMTVLALPIAMFSCVNGAWAIPVYVFLAVNLQYICFFGIAVFSSFCAGNRLGMAALYAILNFFSLLLAGAVQSIFEPMYFGVKLDYEIYGALCPLEKLAVTNIVEVPYLPRLYEEWAEAGSVGVFRMDYEINPGWFGCYAAYALAGLGLMGVSLILYKNRKLECAGDFLAFKALEPVVGVVSALTAAMICRLLFENFAMGVPDYYVSLLVGLILGWFALRMLMERTTRVFGRKNFLGLAILTAAVGLTIGVAWMDPFGLESWIPGADEVQRVEFGSWSGYTVTEDPQEILDAIRLHELALEARLDPICEGGRVYGESGEKDPKPSDMRYAVRLNLTYTLKNGSLAHRSYVVYADSEAGLLLKPYLSRSNSVFTQDQNLDSEEVHTISVCGNRLSQELTTPENARSLMAAIRADCEDGYLPRDAAYHTGYFTWSDAEQWAEGSIYVWMESGDSSQNYGWFSVDVYNDCPNTMKWLTDRGILEAYGITAVETDHPFLASYDAPRDEPVLVD